MVVEIFHAHRRCYGTRRIADDLRDRGYSLGRRRIAKIHEKLLEFQRFNPSHSNHEQPKVDTQLRLQRKLDHENSKRT